MTSTDFASIFAQADPDAVATSDDLPPGEYTGEITHANYKTSRNGHPQFGWRFAAPQGSVWMNQTVSEHATSRNIFVSLCQKFGITSDMLNADPLAAAKSVIGQTWTFTVKHRKNDQNPARPWVDVVLKERAGAAAPAQAAPAEQAAPPQPPAPPAGSRPW